MKCPLTIAATLLILAGLASAGQESGAPKEDARDYRIWPSQPPQDCPFQPSPSLKGLAFTGRHAEYTNADTWYPSWAADGNLYSPWTDGKVDKTSAFSGGKDPCTGHAKIIGDDPLHLERIVDVATVKASAAPYGGRYPCGTLVYRGVWYYGTYCLMNENGSLEALVKTSQGDINWGVLGPFVGFRHSKDFGKTWIETKHTPAHALFPEPKKFGGPVKIGSPHFVDFGKDMQHSPDGKAYLVAHGAVDPDPQPRIANASWITGDQIFLLRVEPTPDNIDDASKYEFYAGTDTAGKPVWTHDFEAMKPLIDWNNRCGCVTMTYNPPLKKYLMCVTDGGNTVGTFNTWILESDALTGPWRLVTFMHKFGPQAYFVNFPSKFIESDGRTLWLCFAANFMADVLKQTKPDPPDVRYAMCLQQVRLLGPD